MKKGFILLVFILMFMPMVYGKEYHMKLLALRSDENTGSEADLYLEVIPGSGRIFLETFPLTRFDTQISTRFAKEIACNFLDVNCDNHDFIYTIRSNSAIIGGPSASAAIAILTVAALDKLEIYENTSITGVINSGGIVSPIGGATGKIEAGSKIGLKKILIPKGQSEVKFNETNESVQIDLISFGEDHGVKIVEVADLNDAMFEFTGKRYYEEKLNLKISDDYSNTMKDLALSLCTRSKELKKNLSTIPDDLLEVKIEAYNLTQRANTAFKNQEYYSTASFCFGANTKYSFLNLRQTNLSGNDLLAKGDEVQNKIDKFRLELNNKNIKTITDLETFMVVTERLNDAEEFLRSARLSINNDNVATNNIAYATERLSSAESWYIFFDHRGKEFNLNNEILLESCLNKLSEADERVQYVSTLFPETLTRVRGDINEAYQDMENGSYQLCLFKASKAKAEIDIIMSTFGVDEDKVGDLLITKLELAEKNIIKQTENNIFPILGYSYYEYATSLKDTDQFSALLFTEYALELSNLDLYFEKKKQVFLLDIDGQTVFIFGIGAIAGLLFAYMLFLNYKKSMKRKK